MEKLQCGICNNDAGNLTYIVREMMFGLREQFKYFQCSQCGCLQIAEIPLDMRPYYPSEKYYSFKASEPDISFKSKLGIVIRKRILHFYLNGGDASNSGLIRYLLREKEYRWMTRLKGLNLSSEILDVGSGTGSLLLDLNKLGFKNLTGIDPFIEKEISYECGVSIFKQDIYDITKMYDLVMLNHVFEHMDDPHEKFSQMYKLLKPNGCLLIRIPVVDCFSWRKYGINWFQLDAPRHFFLHTVRSMAILAKSNGFKLLSVDYDSTENQFYHSEKYIRGKSLFEELSVNPKVLNSWKKHAKWLNSTNDGDQACLIFSKTSTGG